MHADAARAPLPAADSEAAPHSPAARRPLLSPPPADGTDSPFAEPRAAISAQEAVERARGLLYGPGSATGRTLLGLAGPPAAGKSTLAQYLVAEIVRLEGPGAAAYLPLDGFHLANAQLDRLGLRARKGAPATFDAAGYLALLRRVGEERFHEIYVPDFDRALDEPVAARHVVHPHTRLVVTEGNYLGAVDGPWSAVRSLLRELWYVEADDEVRHSRLLARHTAGGGTAAAAAHRIAENDGPNGEFVKGSRSRCDLRVRAADLPAKPAGRSVL